MFLKKFKCFMIAAILFVTLMPTNVLADDHPTPANPNVQKNTVEFTIVGDSKGKIKIDTAELTFDADQTAKKEFETGTNVVFTVIPDANFHTKEVIVNEETVEVTENNEYSIPNIQTDSKVTVSFDADMFPVKLQQTEHGQIHFADDGAAEEKMIAYGKPVKIFIYADEDYQLDKISYKENDGEMQVIPVNDPSVQEAENGAYEWTKETVTGKLEISAEYAPIGKLDFNVITIESPEDYASEANTIIFADKPVTIQVHPEKINGLQANANVKIEVIFQDGTVVSGTDKVELKDSGVIERIRLIYRKSFFRKDKKFIDIDPIRLVKDTSKPDLKLTFKEGEQPSYNTDIPMNIRIENANDKNISGLKKVIYWFDQPAPDNSAISLFDAKKNMYSEQEKLETNTDYSFTVKAAEHNGSKINLYVRAEFLSGSVTTKHVELDIDTVAPKVKLVYDNNQAVNGEYFSKERKATLEVTERSDHFDAEAAKQAIHIAQVNGKNETIDEPLYSIGEWKTTKGATADEDTHSIEITYTGDAVYHFSFRYTDTAGNVNEAIHTDEQKAPFTFAVDQSKPKAEIKAVSDTGREESWSGLQAELKLGYWANKKITFSQTSEDETATVDAVFYHIEKYSNKESDASVLTEAQLAKLNDWKKFDSFDLTEEGTYAVYAKVVDKAGNISYISTAGLIIDDQMPSIETNAPLISINPAQTENAVYNQDVQVNVHVSEPIVNNSYSGLKTVSYVVRNMGEQTQSGILKEADVPDGLKLGDLISSIDGDFTVLSADNNSNDVEIEVVAEDYAGNVSVKKLTIKIDTTAPFITVSYDNNNAGDGKYFNAPRTATVTVRERNFNPAFIDMKTAASGGSEIRITDWSHSEGSGNGDDSMHTAVISYTADDDYSFSVSGKDIAGNASSGTIYAEGTLAGEEFTIDQTRPTVSVSYNNNNVRNGKYFNAPRTATITIHERNFDTRKVVSAISGIDGGNALAPGLSGWTDHGDDHTATVAFATDGLYQFDIDFTDKAGNAAADYAKDEFYIDLTKPQLEIRDVADQSANNGRVAPVLQYTDTNFDPAAVEITLSGAIRGVIANKGFYNEIQNGQIYTYFDFAYQKEEDDIYTLTARITDKAGNTEEKKIMFSVNRFGSAYGFDDNTKKISGKYIREAKDIIIYETNVDPVNHVKLTLFKNNETIILQKDKDYQVAAEGGNGSWYRYTYTINRALFADDAVYSIMLHSEDKAGNISENNIDTKNMSLRFGVDKTAPVITFKNIDKNKVYVAEKYNAEIKLADNLAVQKAEIYLDGKLVVTLDASQLEELLKNSGDYVLEINSADNVRNVKVILTDAAGNTAEEEIGSFFVTTNLWIRFVNNRPLFFGTIALLTAGLGFVFFILWKRRKKINNSDESKVMR